MYRTNTIDPDYRRLPKTNCYCEVCSRDLDPAKPWRWIAWELDKLPEIIHPDDLPTAWIEIRARRAPHHHFECIQFGRIGPECLRKLGKEWTLDEPPAEMAVQWITKLD